MRCLKSLNDAECRLFSYLYELKAHIEISENVGQAATDVRTSMKNTASVLFGGDVAVWVILALTAF